MCLHVLKIHEGHGNQPFVAKEDLKVWKVLNHFNYWAFDDNTGEVVQSSGIKTPYRGVIVNFTAEHKCVISANYLPKGFMYVDTRGDVNAGVHGFYVEPAPTNSYHGIEVHPAIIPKGTQFFLGDNNEVVAEKMIVYETELFCPLGIEEIDINTITF